MKKETKLALFARLALLFATIIWGSSFFMMKDTVDILPPNFVLAIRFTTACILLAVIFFPRLKKLNREYIWQGAIIGACLFSAYCSQTIGLTGTTPGKNAFLTAVYCVIVPFMSWAVNRKRPNIWNISAALLCLCGIGFVSLTGNFTIGFGDGFTLLGGFFYAAHIIAVSKFSQGKDPILITIIQFAYCAIFAWIFHLSFESPPAPITSGMLLSLGYLAIGCTAVALLLQNIGQKYTPPASASIILSLESVFGVLFSVIIYNEQLTPRLICGFTLIFIAVIISETKLSFITNRIKAAHERA